MTPIVQKLVVDLPAGSQASAELLWGEPTGPAQYQLKSVPVWSYGLGYEDVVEATLRDDGRLHVNRVVKPSGFLTVRAAGPEADKAVLGRLFDALQKAAVAVELLSPSYGAFAMEADAFSAIEPLIDEAERTGKIFVQVAND